MNLKRTFGAILTVLGIVGLIYTGVCIINHTGYMATLFVVGIIGMGDMGKMYARRLSQAGWR